MPRSFERIVDTLVLMTGWWLIILSLLTCVEMVSRKLFSFSLQGIDEVGGYTLAVVGAVGFSHTLLTRGHTRIDFLIGKLSIRIRSALNALAMISLAAMAVFAVWRCYAVFAESIEFQSRATTPLQTPLWIPQGLWLTGWALFAIVAVFMACHAVWLSVQGRHEALNTCYGPQTLLEEIESEAGEVLAAVKAEANLIGMPRGTTT